MKLASTRSSLRIVERKCVHRRLFLYYVYLDRTRWRGWRPD